jgi:hypothetical protein
MEKIFFLPQISHRVSYPALLKERDESRPASSLSILKSKVLNLPNPFSILMLSFQTLYPQVAAKKV